MTGDTIRFNRPTAMGRELEYMGRAIEQGRISGDYHFTLQCQALLQEVLGAPKVLLTTSCTHALEMSALLLDIQPGDEVILPAFTFVSTVNAYVLRGARPVFADIRLDTLNLDESKVESLVSPRTRAIVAVHYAGVSCEMDDILEISDANGVSVVEDNAHGLFGEYKGRQLGTMGTMGTLSFHETKNVTCGEGGALIISDQALIERAEIVREKGTDRSRFFRGQVDKYTWVDLGSSYLPSDILAAFLYGQLEARNEIQDRRRQVWQRYSDGLGQWAEQHGVKLPAVPDHCSQSYHMFYVLLPMASQQMRFIQYLKARGVHSVFHYLPLHLSRMGRRFGGQEGDCPNTEDVSGRLVRLPFHNCLSQEQQSRVIDAVLRFDEW
jgi:dTDP-4-amino-4,6-dideoxygalactose transaminase